MFKATIPIAAILLCLPGPEAAVRPAQLSTTAHQPLPRDASELWLVPAADDVSPRALTPYKSLIDGAAAFAAGDYAGALPLVSQPSLASTELRDYAAYYAAAARLRLSKSADARALFHALRERKPQGYLSVSSAIGEAEAAEALGDYKAAVSIYEDLAGVEDHGQRGCPVAAGARRAGHRRSQEGGRGLPEGLSTSFR